MGLLLAQAGGPGLELGQILAQGGGLGEGLLELGLLRLQLGDQAAFVEPAAVEPGLEAFVGLGPGYILLPGGDQGGDPLLQLLALADGQASLAEEHRAVKDLLAHASEDLPGGLPGQAGHGQAGVLVDRRKIPHGHPAGGGPAELQDPALEFTDQQPLHGGAAPGPVTVFVGGGALAVPLAGVQAVEHGPQEGAPGGFPAAVGGPDEGHPRAEFQGVPL